MFKQEIGILMDIDPAPYWANFFLYIFESKYVQQLMSKAFPRTYKFHGTSRFIDDLCTINDDGEFFFFIQIYLAPKILELKLEHQGEHATFLDLEITIADNVFIYKLFNKREKFPFFIVRMLHLSSNIPSSIFYSSIFSEFVPKGSQLYTRTIRHGGNKASILPQYCKTYDKLIQRNNYVLTSTLQLGLQKLYIYIYIYIYIYM